MTFRRCAALLGLLLLWPFMAQAKDVRVYIFGNSLINHLDGGDETTVPYWLAQMAKANGTGFASDGQWGFLRDFAREGEPISNWSFKGVKPAWNRDRVRFAAADLTHIMVNPANFIQYQWPDVPYDGDNPDGASPLSTMLKLMDTKVGARPLLIYEGWAEMAGVAGRFPPRTRDLRKFHDYNIGAYHDWYVKLAEQLRTSRPEADVRLVPVARTLSQLLSDAPLDAIPVEDLYLDDAPHGAPTLYFLAAMSVYPALYGEAAPAEMSLPDSIHPLVRDNLAKISARITALQGVEEQASVTEPVKAAPSPAVPSVSHASFAPPEGQIANPSLALGLDGVSDWSTQHPFLNIMKTARPWVGHVGDQWGAIQMSDLMEQGLVDAHGYPRIVPAGASKLESFVLTDQPEDATDMNNRYRIRWKGEGKLTITGRGQTARTGERGNETWLEYSPGEGLVAIGIESTDPNGTGNYIRDIEIVREDHIPLYDAGATFNPAWIRRIENVRSLRFMDWMLTNGSPVKTWEGRPTEPHFSYAWQGVPAEVIIRLSNQIGADPWICMPHEADDTYMRQFAELTKATLDPRLKVYVEFSNELWNHIFPQTKWAVDQARKRWNVEQDAWMQFSGLRAAEVMTIWSDVFGAEANERLVRVMGVHTGWTGLEEPFLEAPLAVAEGLTPPKESFDAYAVSGYFGFDLGLEEEALPQVRQIVAKSVANAEEEGRKKGLQRRALEAEIEPIRFDQAYPQVAELLWNGSFKELTETFWPYHAEKARSLGMSLVMYEGGTHVTPHGEALNDEELVDFFTSFNYNAEVGKLYEELLRRWRDAGGTLFNAFVDVAPATKYGSWGALRHLQDENPRWDALMAANAIQPDLPPRAAGTFLNGLTLYGGQGADRLVGTPEEDALIGGPGDDFMVSGGGADHFNGGAGFDTVELVGRSEEYQIYSVGGLVHVQRGSETSYLLDIEALYFADEPTRKYRLDLQQ
ncbi:calcium-binding protein [Lentibacter sp. XHP0401]|uniref:calcium-binding protein n=1 Tax=Lentibacter sp. XHP0401 TaxID=2984334 RepID=UPI0021E732E8|nr:calcium-binding protein [Lentibacter sp. XHP0401]MCV2893396.1 calcium-binding protein [Lentibacter sp. XHP0401]